MQAQSFGEESFYAWTYEKPVSPWAYVAAGAAVVAALLISLFPLAPNWVKVSSSAALRGAALCCAVRCGVGLGVGACLLRGG